MTIRLARRAAMLFAAAVGVFSLGLRQGRCDVNLFWIGGHSDQYDDGQNWSYFEGTNVQPAFAVPGTGNFVVFEQSADISFSDYSSSQPPTNDLVQILNGSVTFNLGPISYQDAVARTYTTNGLYVVAPFEDSNFLQNYNLPNGANSTLAVSGGTLVVNGSAEIGGGDSRNVGTLTLQASQLTLTAGLTVAQSSHGNLNIESASYVTTSGGNVSIGGQSGSVGTATVSGGSTWLLDSSAPLTVGVQGSGSLLVEGGSLVSGVTLSIGGTGPTPASVTVDGADSQLNFPNFALGAGNGTLAIQNGASVTSGSGGNTTIGEFNGYTGSATVTGAGSNWTTNGLAIGAGSGQGSLVISGGASVTSTDYLANVNGTPTLISSSIGGSQSSVQVVGNGSTWTLTGGLSLIPSGTSTASLTVGTGSTVNIATLLQVNPGGTVQVDGTLNAATLYVSGGSFTQTGTVNLSDASTHVGVLSISGGGTYTGAPTLGVPSAGNTDATGQATIRDIGSTWTIPVAYFLGAGGGECTANVQMGAAVYSGDLGIGENTAGQLQVDGTGSSWTSSGTIRVGSVASGSVGLSNGASLTASTLCVNGQGTVNVNNSALQATNLNVNGGSVKVNNGTLTSTNTVIPSGSMQLTNATWNNSGTLCVGGADSPAATVYIFGGTTTLGGALKIGSSGQIALDGGGGASLNVNDVDIEGGSLDVYSFQVNGSGGSLTVAAHGEYAQSYGDFNASNFNNVTVNGALLSIQNGSINVCSGQTLAATNGAIVCAPNGSLNIGAGGNVSANNSTISVSSIYVAGNLSLTNAALQAQSIALDGGTIGTSTPLSIDSSIKGNGTINGAIQLAGGTVQADGGSLTINGNVSGYGVLLGNVAATSLTPSGDLNISGNQNDLGSQSAVLLSQHAATLSGIVYSNGGTVTSANGLLVASGGEISGDITINGNVENDGLLDVGGPTIGVDTIDGNLLLDDGGTVHIKIAGSDPSDYDRIMVLNGDVTLGGTLDLDFIDGFLPKQGDQFNIFLDDFSGSFSDLQVDGLGTWQYSLTPGSSGVTLASLSDAAPVPEPSPLVLLAVGGLLLMVYRKRLRRFADRERANYSNKTPHDRTLIWFHLESQFRC